MSALHGREDPMLDASRFDRLVRQAHDAEIVDVRKVGENQFEVIARGLDGPPPATAARTAEAAPGAAPPQIEMALPRGGVRFRRGSRIPTAAPAIQMVGVVSLDEEPAPAQAPARPARGRKKVAKPAEAGEDEAAPPPRKKAGRSRARKKSSE